MVNIALVLALLEKPTTTWTWLNMLLMLMNVTSNPMEKGIRKQVQNQKLVREFCNRLQETNQTGNVKIVSRIHAGNGLIMTIAYSGKGKRSHERVFKIEYTLGNGCTPGVSILDSE